MSNYVPIIGLEIHAELDTQTKLFCRCANTSHDLDTPPNTAICPVCLGLPGALPVLNKQAVLATIKLGHSLGSRIPDVTKWDRKNYFYPDLPKGYQISQCDEPLCQGGFVRWIDRHGHLHDVAVTRVHLEEDTGKLNHPAGAGYSLIDYNRSSIPLLELVTEPVIVSADEARQFAEEYQLRLRELGIAEASMEKGQMRCEANISVVPEEWAADPTRRLKGTKVEVKNLNSFRSLERAITYEIARQTHALEEGSVLRQETRGWNEAKGETYSMRAKETSDDYRYFPEPDLFGLDCRPLKQEEHTAPPSRLARFEHLLQLGISPNVVHAFLADPERFNVLEGLIAQGLSIEGQKTAVQWLSNAPLLLMCKDTSELARLLEEVASGIVPSAIFKEAVAQWNGDGVLTDVVAQRRLDHVVDDLDTVITDVLAQHSDEVARYKAGDTKLFGFFIGQIRAVLRGKGDPSAIAETLTKQLQ